MSSILCLYPNFFFQTQRYNIFSIRQTLSAKKISKAEIYTKYSLEDGLTVLSSDDDAATQNWGTKWRMPTREECKELIKECAWQMTYDYCGTSVWGFTVTGKNGASIFLPHVGVYYVTVGAYDDEVKTHIEDLVIYRSSCLSHGNEDALSFGPNGYPDSKYWNIPEEWDKLKTWMTVTTLYGRYSGIAVRAVCK